MQGSESVLFTPARGYSRYLSRRAIVRLAMLMKTPDERSCIIRTIAWVMDWLKVTKYSNSSTACCVLSETLPLPLSRGTVLSCATMESCTLVRHLNKPRSLIAHESLLSG